ncbi:hypothetical protein NXS98_07395 [Fontisphaera persica]|uniref:hypothetical protein n=1 Tax=Fontisphaera persica TaxID=2974023 RepID=UPI0024BFDEF7|nr:hypothetical protein [Fontisphaera persica]WCJ60934.1 hypothetical protein NXS98_07395 [Fontisphaera persica]
MKIQQAPEIDEFIKLCKEVAAELRNSSCQSQSKGGENAPPPQEEASPSLRVEIENLEARIKRLEASLTEPARIKNEQGETWYKKLFRKSKNAKP